MADGSTVSVSMVGASQQGTLWIHAQGLSLVECVNIFSNPQKTSHMHIQYDPTIYDDFYGYTELISVAVCDDYVKIGMVKP